MSDIEVFIEPRSAFGVQTGRSPADRLLASNYVIDETVLPVVLVFAIGSITVYGDNGQDSTLAPSPAQKPKNTERRIHETQKSAFVHVRSAGTDRRRSVPFTGYTSEPHFVHSCRTSNTACIRREKKSA